MLGLLTFLKLLIFCDTSRRASYDLPVSAPDLIATLGLLARWATQLRPMQFVSPSGLSRFVSPYGADTGRSCIVLRAETHRISGVGSCPLLPTSKHPAANNLVNHLLQRIVSIFMARQNRFDVTPIRELNLSARSKRDQL